PGDGGQDTRPDRGRTRGRIRSGKASKTRRRHIRVHVVRTPAPRARNRRLASAHDGVRTLQRQLDGRRQRVRQCTAAGERRCRDPIYCDRDSGGPEAGRSNGTARGSRGRPPGVTGMLENKVAVIYGAGGAIGSAVARAFAREGARLFLTGRQQASVEAVAKDVVSAGGSAEAA